LTSSSKNNKIDDRKCWRVFVISSETPYKLAEIIRDTWPNLYRPAKETYNTKSQKKKNV
jgi:hypothetical protein